MAETAAVMQIEVSEDEDPEGVYKRFRNSCNLSGMVYEARTAAQHLAAAPDLLHAKNISGPQESDFKSAEFHAHCRHAAESFSRTRRTSRSASSRKRACGR